MPLIVRCDAPNCASEAKVTLTQDGRLMTPTSDWWIGRGTTTRVACCKNCFEAVLMGAVAAPANSDTPDGGSAA